MQIYNESLHDLLGKDPTTKLDVKQRKDGNGHHVPNVNVVEVKSVEDINNVSIYLYYSSSMLKIFICQITTVKHIKYIISMGCIN